jgi:hypothetical protein
MAQPRELTSTQFRLRSLIALMFAVAIASWVVTVVPPRLWLVLTIHALPVVAFTICILGAVYLPGGMKAFCLGYGLTLFQVVVLTFLLVDNFDYQFIMRYWEVMALVPVLCIVLPSAVGLVGVYFHGIAQRAKQAERAVTTAIVNRARQQAVQRPRPVVREVLEIRDEAENQTPLVRT